MLLRFLFWFFVHLQLNKDPFGESWLVKLKVSQPKDLDALLDASSYHEVVEKEKH
jgi:glycine cleavage system H lipoate-binding protein